MRLTAYLGRHAEFVGHVATMMSGKGLAAAIALLTTPIVARLFEPSDFGIAAVFASIVGITSNIASLRYAAAIVIPAHEDEARRLMVFSYRVVFTFCAIMLLIIAVMDMSNVDVAAFNLLQTWVWALPLGTLVMAAIHVQESWLTRCKNFGTISASLVVGNSVTSGSRIAMGFAWGSTVYGLIIGQLLGAIIRLGVQRRAGRLGIHALTEVMSIAAMRKIAVRYADFPLLNAPAGLVFSLGQNLPVLLFGGMFSPAVAGLYAMANRLAKVPVTIGTTSMRRVFLQKASSVHNGGGNLRRAFLLTLGGLVALGIIPAVVAGLFGQPILSWLLGSNWSTSGHYLEIMAPWMFMTWVTSPCNAVFVVLRKQKFWLMLQLSLTVLRLCAFAVAFAITATPEWTLAAFVVATAIGNLVTIITTTLLTAPRDNVDAGKMP